MSRALASPSSEAPEAANADLLPNTAGKQTPRRMRRAAEILAAARESFLEKGFERASISEIAAKVGVVEGLVYSYFPTKRDLLNEVLRAMYEPLIRDVDESFSRLQGLRSRLRFLIWRHLRVYVEESSLSRLVLHEVRTGPEYFKSVLHDLHVRYTAFLMRTIREAVEAGELPAETDEEMVRGMVYGGIEHRMWATLFGRGTIDLEATADRYTAMVLRGILPADTTSSQTSRDDTERRLARLEQIIAAQADRLPAPSPAKPLRKAKT
ncbi:MAG: TetR/AcrR family transcriptional regulator [Pseudomonadota bacterium]